MIKWIVEIPNPAENLGLKLIPIVADASESIPDIWFVWIRIGPAWNSAKCFFAGVWFCANIEAADTIEIVITANTFFITEIFN